MKTTIAIMGLAALMMACSREPQKPTSPPAATTDSAPDADRQVLQELRDIGYTPQMVMDMALVDLARKQAVLDAGLGTPPAPATAPASPTGVATGAAAGGVAAPEPVPTEEQTAPIVQVVQAQPPAPTFPPITPVTIVNEIVITNVVAQAPVVANVTYFYDGLVPYGTWIRVSPYGLVWQPYVTVTDVDWRPYCNGGYWIWTDSGWYWSSSYSWGWAPFHYGRWCYVSGYRWCWVPDTVWSPAWVVWKTTDECFGWAPLPPGTTWQASTVCEWDDADTLEVRFDLSWFAFTFVGKQHFADKHWHNHVASRKHTEDLYRHGKHVARTLKSAGDRILNMGVPIEQVESAIRHRIPPVPLIKTTAVSTPASPTAWNPGKPQSGQQKKQQTTAGSAASQPVLSAEQTSHGIRTVRPVALPASPIPAKPVPAPSARVIPAWGAAPARPAADPKTGQGGVSAQGEGDKSSVSDGRVSSPPDTVRPVRTPATWVPPTVPPPPAIRSPVMPPISPAPGRAAVPTDSRDGKNEETSRLPTVRTPAPTAATEPRRWGSVQQAQDRSPAVVEKSVQQDGAPVEAAPVTVRERVRERVQEVLSRTAPAARRTGIEVAPKTTPVTTPSAQPIPAESSTKTP